MSNNTILIKRRLPDSPLGTQIPTLSNGELGFNEVNSVLYYGASAGTLSIGGSGAFVDRMTDQTISGNKTFLGNVSATGQVTIDLSTAVNTTSSFVVENAGKLEKRFLDLSVVPQFTFTKNLTVSIDPAKSFGRYRNLDIIESAGKTVPQVLEMVVVEPITPGVLLQTSSTISFNQTSITNILTFNHNISSLGATLQSGVFEWKRNNESTWVTLSTASHRVGSLTHVTTNDAFNTNAFNYRYRVTDSVGATNTATANVTVQTYTAPTVAGVSIGSTTRDKGDTNTTYTGTLTKQRALVPIASYQLQRSINSGGTWTNVGAAVSVTTDPSTISINITDTNTSDNAVLNANTLRYRIVYTDSFTSTPTFAPGSETSDINLVHRNALILSSNASLTISDIDNASIVATTAVGAIRSNSRVRTINAVTANPTQFTYYAYAASAGNLTQIIQDGATPVITAFQSPTDITGTNSNGATVTYRVYKSNADKAFTNATLAFT